MKSIFLLLLTSLSIFGQGVTYSSTIQPYQVTYVGSGGGSNSTTIIAGSNVTVVTNANNNFTISSSGGGSGISTLNGFGTNTTLSGSTVNNTPVQILGYASQVSTLLQVGQLGGLGNKLFVVGPTGILYGNGTGLTNSLGSAFAPIAGPSFTGGVSVNGGFISDTITSPGAVQLNGTLQITSGSPAAGKVWTGSDGSGNGSWQPATGGSGGGTNMVPTALSYSGGTNVALVGTLPTGSIGPIRYKLTMTTNTFLQVPSGSPVDQATMIIVINQDAVGTWSYLHDTNSAGGFGMSIVDLPLPLPNSTNALSTDVVGYIYLAARNKWFVTSHIRSLQ